MIERDKYYFIITSIFIFVFCVFPLSFIVGARDWDMGTDTANYINIFQNFVYSGQVDHEPGIYFFAYVTKLIGGDVSIFFQLIFLFVFLCVTLTYFNFFHKKTNVTELCLFYIFLWGSFFLSSWFQVSTVNVLRHGLALYMLYLSLALYTNKNYLLCLLVYVSSVFFHYSLLLFAPFFLILNIKDKYFYSLYLLMVIGYPTGINEVFVKYISIFLGLPIYDYIYTYDEDNLRWFGFDLFFYLYTIFWFVFLVVIRRFFCSPLYESLLNKFIRLYSALTMVFFIFGFASFSNRYAFFSWLFIPFIQVALVLSFRFSGAYKVLLSISIFIFGVFNYLGLFYSYLTIE